MSDTLLLVIHAGATWYMVGLIWFVQVVHYPLFASVSPDHQALYAAYQAKHMRLTTCVVAPGMLVEAAAAAWLVLASPAGVPVWTVWLGLGLVGVNWISTAAVQVPCHRKLEHGFDHAAHAKLVRTNWLRTAAWSARGVLAGWMVLASV